MKSCRISCRAWTLVLFVSLGLSAGSDSLSAKQKNVLFLFSDDQVPGTLGALGHPDVKTPNIDRLYRKGFHFNQGYSMGSMIGPVCLPSRSMLLSGKSLFRAPRRLDRGAFLPEVFRRAGYTTFSTGKWHNGAESWLRGFEKGEAVFLGGAADHRNTRVNRAVDGKLVPYDNEGAMSTKMFGDAAVKFLKAQKSAKKPFFCYVPFTAPHTPHVSPAEFQALYDPAKIHLPVSFKPRVRGGRPGGNDAGGRRRARPGGTDGSRRPGRRGGPGGGRSSLGSVEDARKSYVQYYALVSYMDHHIGRILDALEESGQHDDTIVVFASDHGYSMGHHGQSGKTNLYEHGVGAMINFSGPGIPVAKSSEALVYLYDLFPTLCDLAGLETPADVEGKSLAAILRGKQEKVRDEILIALPNDQRALRQGHWKVHKLGGDSVRLFNLQADPHEMKDLSAEPAHRERLESLLAALEASRKKYGETPEVVAELARSRRGGGGGGGRRGGRRPRIDPAKVADEFAKKFATAAGKKPTDTIPAKQFRAVWKRWYDKWKPADGEGGLGRRDLERALSRLVAVDGQSEDADRRGTPRGRGSRRGRGPGPGAGISRAFFTAGDADQNVELDLEEFEKVAADWAKSWDDDHDGLLSGGEIRAHIAAMLTSQR
jgi:arylsulfatase A-like enzyme